MPDDYQTPARTLATPTTPDSKPRQVLVGMNVNLPAAIDVDLDPLVITIAIPPEWFDARFQQTP